MNLATTYMGLKLASPLIVGAGPLTRTPDQVKACADAGAGAVVLNSLFEEEIAAETQPLEGLLAEQSQMHAEAYELMQAQIGLRYGTRDYLRNLEACKKAVGIPVIASINCVSERWWNDFAGEVAAAGADALELNLAVMPETLTRKGVEIEDHCVRMVAAARAAVTIPLAVKIGPYFSALPELTLRLQQAGADGFVLFNRFYRPTIDIVTRQVKADKPWSTSDEQSLALRWIATLAGRINADFSSATGIHSGDDAVRLLLAGAQTVQCVTTLLRNKVTYLRQMQADIAAWMTQNNYEPIDAFRGQLSLARNPDSPVYSRIQYMKVLAGS